MEILRFTLQRPAFAASYDILNCIQVKNGEQTQSDLLKAAADGNVEKFEDPKNFSSSFIFEFEPTALEASYISLRKAVSEENKWTLAALRAEISKDFGVPFEQIPALAAYKSDKTRLQNSAVLAKFSPRYPSWNSKENLIGILRIANLIDLVNSGDRRIEEALKDGSLLQKKLLRLPIIVPEAGPRASSLAESFNVAPKSNPEQIARLQALYDKIATLPSTEFYIPASNPPDPNEPVFGSIKESALSTTEKDLLKTYAIDFLRLTGEQVLARIDAAINSIQSNIRLRPEPQTILAGTSLVSSSAPPKMDTATSSRIVGNFRPVGIADLLVVEQQLVGYVKADVAHIENVLEGETRSRVHARKETTEVEVTTETENTREEERDLQTTDRAEVKREISQLLKEEESLKAGASLSASYGPTVEFKTYVDGTTSSTLEQAQKQASTYSKETVSRAVSKVVERILEKRRIRNVIELEEVNKHEFSVSSGVGVKNITGVYQWVEKIYEAQAWNYGKRVLYDVVVPEPAARAQVTALQDVGILR